MSRSGRLHHLLPEPLTGLTPGPDGVRPQRNDAFGLKKTRQEWHKQADGSQVFNTPDETGRHLDSRQGKVPGFSGTCGIVSCVNLFRLAGLHATEEDFVRYASSARGTDGRHTLCVTGCGAKDNGGTSYKDRQRLMAAFGMDSFWVSCPRPKPDEPVDEAVLEKLASFVEEGRGVIISVHAGTLRDDRLRDDRLDLHAVTVTSTKRDANGGLLGFYICDSNGRPSEFCYPATIQKALSGMPMNVSSAIIR